LHDEDLDPRTTTLVKTGSCDCGDGVETGRGGTSASVLVAASDDELRTARLLARLSPAAGPSPPGAGSLSTADDDDASTARPPRCCGRRLAVRGAAACSPGAAESLAMTEVGAVNS